MIGLGPLIMMLDRIGCFSSKQWQQDLLWMILVTRLDAMPVMASFTSSLCLPHMISLYAFFPPLCDGFWTVVVVGGEMKWAGVFIDETWL